MAEWLNNNAGILSLIAILVSIITYLKNCYDKRKSKKAELESLKKAIKCYGTKIPKEHLCDMDRRAYQLQKELRIK